MFDCYVNKNNVLSGLKKLQSVAEKNPIIPMTSNMLIEAKKDTLIVSATNFEVGVIIKNNVKIGEEGRIVIDARKIYEIIKEMPEGEIHISKKDSGRIEINYDNKIVFNINGIEEEGFPPIEIDSGITFSEINTRTVLELIKKTIYATSEDRSREVLRGILVEKQKNILRMVATDGHRLALADKIISNNEELIIKKGVIIPKKGAREIKGLIEELDKDEKIKIGFGEKSLVVKGKEETVVIRLIEGEFPDYKKVITLNNKNKMVIKTNELIESLNRVILIIDEDIKAVNLSIKKGLLVISSKKAGFGEAREERDIDYLGEELEIGLNGRYILDVLNVMEGGEVVLEILNEKTPILIKEEGKENNIAVIMPMVL